jgi:hypothetical protein
MDGWGGWMDGRTGRQIICIPYFLASTEDNIHIKENTPKCNKITEQGEGVSINLSGQYDTNWSFGY